VCACFRAGASTFQVLARYDSVRARYDSADAYFFPARTRYDSARARLYSVRARLYTARAHLYSVHARQSTSHFRPRLPHKRPPASKIYKCTRKYRPRPWLSVCARRHTVRTLEHPVRAGINAFAPEGSRETTAACARGTISPRPIAMHNVQSHCTWACNCASSCLLGTSLVRTKADFI
jgi:hypothetical protein